VPEELETVVAMALQKNPEKRYKSGLDLAAELTRVHQKLRQRYARIDQQEQFATLRRLKFFHEFSHAEIWEVLRASNWQDYAGAEEIVKEGEIGEIWLRGTRGIQLFLEYYDNEEANNKAFNADGWLQTGDLVLLGPDGNLEYRDRDKDALKVGGENVSAREVEDQVRTVPGIADVAVVGKSHEMLDQVAVAFVVKADPNQDDDELAAAIIAACKTNLADFKVPRAVYFVDDFPKATLDKVAKNELREMADAHPAV